jgi:molecular chaperone Hsp33
VADALARALGSDGTVRGLAAVTTALVEDARLRHQTLPTATAALGRTLTAALLLAGLVKADERVSVQVSGDGPLGGILVDATPDGAVRGFVSRPRTHLAPRAGKLDVGSAVGRGLLCVMRIPPLGEGPAYRSVVPLVSGEIGEDVASYLASSEQTPSVVAVGVFVEPDGTVGAAGGYLLQAMPGAPPDVIDRLEANVRTAAAPSELVRTAGDPRAMLAGLLTGFAIRLLEEHPVRFACRCTRARVESAILAMGRAELVEVLGGDGRVEMACEFCGARYVLEEPELRELLGGSA